MWFFQRLRSAKSQPDEQQQHQDSQLQSESSVDNDKQVQVLAQDLKNLVISSKEEVIDRYIQTQSVVTEEEDQVKQVVDEDHRHLVVKEAVNEALQANSSNKSEAKNHWDVQNALIVDTKERRVSEERETGERCDIQGDEKIYEHKNGVLKEKHEIEFETRGVSSKTGSYVNNNVDGRIPDDSKLKSKAYHDPLRPDCSHYTRTGMCKFGSNCRFNHPHIGEIQPTKDPKKKMEENTGRHGPIECKPPKDTKKKKEENMERHGPIESKPDKETKKQIEENVYMRGPVEFKQPAKKTNKKKEENVERHGLIECKPTKETKKKKEETVERHGPIEFKPTNESKNKKEENVDMHGPVECKPAKEIKKKKEENVHMHGPIECKQPTKEVKKKKEENMESHRPIECKPTKVTKKKKEETVESHRPVECKHPTKETKKKIEENVERHGPIECKYHMSSAGCKYGKACKFNHGKGKNVKTPVIEYNFLGLPIRPGEKECSYYMRNGFCQHGPTCRLHHPDPIAVESVDAPTSCGNDGPPLQPTPQPNIPIMPSWSPTRTLDPTAAGFVPMMYSPPQNMPPPNPDWSGLQASAHLYPSSEWGPPIPPPFFHNNSPSDTNMYTHQQQPMLVSESHEKPGARNCRYFMKTGDCKNGASCKFRHPQSRLN